MMTVPGCRGDRLMPEERVENRSPDRRQRTAERHEDRGVWEQGFSGWPSIGLATGKFFPTAQAAFAHSALDQEIARRASF